MLVLTTALSSGDQATGCPRPVGRQIFKQQYSQLETLQQRVRRGVQPCVWVYSHTQEQGGLLVFCFVLFLGGGALKPQIRDKGWGK